MYIKTGKNGHGYSCRTVGCILKLVKMGMGTVVGQWGVYRYG